MRRDVTPLETYDEGLLSGYREAYVRRLQCTMRYLLLLTLLAAPAGAEVGPAPTAESAPTLEEKIGQLLLVGFRGTSLEPNTPIMRDLRQRHLGGVILFNRDLPEGKAGRNVQDPEQLGRLVQSLKAAARRPLLIAIDQEGGRVRRLREAFGIDSKVTPKELGALDRPALTARFARDTAKVLAGLGINLNLAPVVDLDLDPKNPVIGVPERSYGKRPAVVTRHALAVVRAHHAEGVLTAIKHFPGHGSARADSHAGLPDVTGRWSERELEPFKRIIASGDCDAVMTAHIVNRAIDAEHPATLSHAVIDGILRKKLGWDGVVMSDDLGMGAITQTFGLRSALRLALNAGVDILVFANNTDYDPDLGERVFGLILELVKSGEVKVETIDAAYARVQRLKAKLQGPVAKAP